MFTHFNIGKLCTDSAKKRIVSQKVWEILASHFPDAPTFEENSPLCSDCQVNVTNYHVFNKIVKLLHIFRRLTKTIKKFVIAIIWLLKFKDLVSRIFTHHVVGLHGPI